MVALARPKTCRAEECLNPAVRGEYCWTHVKRHQRGQDDAPRGPSRSELLREAAIRMADVDSDDDKEFERADANLRKAAKEFAGKGDSERIREGIARARAKGVPIGRPRRAIPEQAAELVDRLGMTAAAKAMGLVPMTLWRAMKRRKA